MARKKLIIKDFSGGIGTLGEKRDQAGSAKFTKGLNPYEDTSYVTTSRIGTKKSSTTIAGLVYWLEDGSPYSTDKYAYDSAGKIYKITSGDAVSLLQTTTGAAGEGLKVFDDYLYYALGTNLGRYGVLSGTPAFNDDMGHTAATGWWGDNMDDLQNSGGGTGAADFVPPTSITEATAAQRQTWTASYDPIYSVTINVDVVGSGDWTLVVHDINDRTVCTKTIANGDMDGVGDQEFVMTAVGRVVIGNSYHFHVTSTVADGGVDTDEATSLAAGAATTGAQYTIEYSPLIDVDWHPMAVIDNTDLIIGNERYLAKFDQATYNANAIILDAGYNVRSITQFEEFIVIAAYKGSSVDDAEYSKLYFWDGISSAPTYASPVTIGPPNAIHNSKGNLMGVYGTRGSVYVGSDPFEKIIDEIPKLTKGKKVEIYPGAISEYEGRTVIGYAGNTDDGTTFEQGVYEFGSQAAALPDSFNFPYQISTGTTKATTVKIGMVKGIGNDLWIGWRDNTTYGLDKIARGDSALAASIYESLIFDGGDPNADILPFSLEVTYEALTANQSVTPKYKLDRAASFTSGTASSTVGDTGVEEGLLVRCKEIEIGFNLASTSNTFQKITSVVLEYDDLSEEKEND